MAPWITAVTVFLQIRQTTNNLASGKANRFSHFYSLWIGFNMKEYKNCEWPEGNHIHYQCLRDLPEILSNIIRHMSSENNNFDQTTLIDSSNQPRGTSLAKTCRQLEENGRDWRESDLAGGLFRLNLIKKLILKNKNKQTKKIESMSLHSNTMLYLRSNYKHTSFYYVSLYCTS